MNLKAFSIKMMTILFVASALITIYILVQENDATTKVVANMPKIVNDSLIVDLLQDDYENLTYSSEGQSSWYGKKFQHRKTASGERYDMNSLTAAHRTLPFGSIALVENLDNKSKVFVRINDRGPFHGKRLIDLSYAGAKMAGNLENSPVRIQSILFNKLSLMPDFQYYLAHSYDMPFRCVPSYQISLIDSTRDFEIACDMYNIERESNPDVYLLTKVTNSMLTAKKMESSYYIGYVKKNIIQKLNTFADKR